MNPWTFIDTFNSREKAIVVWLLLFFLWVLLKKDTRVAVLNVLKVLLDKKVASVVLGMLLYTTFVVLFFYKIGLWEVFLLKDTIFWVLGTAFVLLLNTNKATQSVSFFKEVVVNALKLIVILEFIINFYTFSFWVEMILIPILVVIGGMSALTELKAEYKEVKKFINSVLAGLGFFLIVYALGNVLANYQNFATLQNFHTFVLPPLLTLFYIPYLYLFALVMAYETLFIRFNIFIKDKELLSFTKEKIVLLCHINLGKLNRFAQTNTREIMELSNKNDVWKMTKGFKIKDGGKIKP